jgi:hypothetical protein
MLSPPPNQQLLFRKAHQRGDLILVENLSHNLENGVLVDWVVLSILEDYVGHEALGNGLRFFLLFYYLI